MSSKGILGVDPGETGALCLLVNPLIEPEYWDMPKTPRALCELLRLIGPRVSFSVLEEVHSMPGEGVVSVFKFGRGFGRLESALEAFTPCVVYKSPHLWKSALGLTGGKSDTKKWCRDRKWPNLVKRRHDVREAAALAYYGFMCLGGGI